MEDYQIDNMYRLQSIALARGFKPNDLYWDMDLGTYWALVGWVESHMMIGLTHEASGIDRLWGSSIHKKDNCEEHCNLCISWNAI